MPFIVADFKGVLNAPGVETESFFFITASRDSFKRFNFKAVCCLNYKKVQIPCLVKVAQCHFPRDFII